ncbi:MAG: hypothetical protein ACLU9S_15690 [Oscillospiraceae bacterium]
MEIKDRFLCAVWVSQAAGGLGTGLCDPGTQYAGADAGGSAGGGWRGFFPSPASTDSDSGCAAQTLALSSDMGLLLRKMREDLDTYEIPVILSHVERRIDGYQFSYEAKDAEVEGLYLSYTISRRPGVSQPARRT